MVAELFAMRCQAFNFLLAFTAQYGANGYQQLQDHTIHNMMPLHIEIGIVGNQS